MIDFFSKSGEIHRSKVKKKIEDDREYYTKY